MKGLEELIEDELNVKKVELIADETELCEVSFKANFKTLGKKCGPKMKAVAAAIAANENNRITELANNRMAACEIEGVQVAVEDVLVTRSPKAGLVVANTGAVVVGLETALTPVLVAEGNAREFVSTVQSMRKEAAFEVTQRITLTVETDDEMKASLESFMDYVKNETLADSVTFAAAEADAADLNGHATKIVVTRR